MGSSSKFLLGAILGAAAGAVAGLLFAPRSGKETRKIIGDKAKEYSEKGKEMLEKGRVSAKNSIHNTATTIAEKTK